MNTLGNIPFKGSFENAMKLTIMHIRSDGPVGLDEVARYLRVQCQGVDDTNSYSIARKCVEAWIERRVIEEEEDGTEVYQLTQAPLRFSAGQIAHLRRALGAFTKVDPMSKTWISLCDYLRSLPAELQNQLRAADLPWVRIILRPGNQSPYRYNKACPCGSCKAYGTGEHIQPTGTCEQPCGKFCPGCNPMDD